VKTLNVQDLSVPWLVPGPWNERVLGFVEEQPSNNETPDNEPPSDEDQPPDSETPDGELPAEEQSIGHSSPVVSLPTEEPPAEEQIDIPQELPILPLRGVVFYPMTALPLTVGQPRSVRLVEDAVLSEPRIIGLVASKDADIEEPTPDQIYRVGTAVTLHRLHKTTEGIILFVHGLERIRIDEYATTTPYLKARVTPIPESTEKSVEVEALMRNLVELFRQLVSLVPYLSETK
jgi:ATP-dependent Lon protease